jgi:hypothetical protein
VIVELWFNGTNMVSQARLKELFIYGSKGELIRIKTVTKNAQAGSVAGSLSENKYRKVAVDGQVYYLHRLIWIYFNKKIDTDKEIDHINQNKHDNKIENLRMVPRFVNVHNRPITNRNTSGYKGVHYNKKQNSWYACIKINKKVFHLGVFKTIKDAYKARKIAELLMLKNRV